MKRLILLFFTIFNIPFFCIGQHSVDTLFNISLENLSNVMVSTASKNLETSENAPATIYVFSQEQIQQKGYFYLDELLDHIPEIEIQKRATSEYSNLISIRGIAGNEKFIIMRDGMRINPHTGSVNAVKENYSLHNIKRVEVILGPTSALYGVDAFTGIINLISFSGEELNGGRFTSSYGMYNTGHHAGTWGIKRNDFSIAVDGSFYHSAEAFYPKYYPKEYEWYNDVYSKTGGMTFTGKDTSYYPIEEYKTPTHAYTFSSKLKFKNLEIGYSRNVESHSNSMGMNPQYSIYSKDAIYETDISTLYLRHEYTRKKFSFQSLMSNNNYRVNPKSAFVNIFSSFQKAYKFADEKSSFVQFQGKYTINEQHNILLGTSYQNMISLPNTGDLPHQFTSSHSASSQDMYYLGTNHTDSLGNNLKIEQNFFYVHYRNFGVFAQSQNNLSNRLKMTIGARFDYNNRYGNSFNPRIGFVHQTIPNKLIFKLLYGRAFLAPSPYKAYRHWGSFQYNETTETYSAHFWHLPNPNLKPEKLNNVEATIIYKQNKNLFFKTNFYYIHVNDLIVNEVTFDEKYKGVNISVVERPTNKESTQSYGGTFQINHLHNINHRFIRSNLSYSYANGQTQNRPLSYMAKHTIKMGIDYVGEKLTISPKLLIRSASTHEFLFDEQGDFLQNDGFYVLSLYTSYQLNKILGTISPKLFLKIDNLTNNRYYHISYGNFESLAKSPQEPIRIMGGINMTF